MSPAAGPRSCTTGAWKPGDAPTHKLMRDVKAVDWLPLEEAVERLSRGYERAFLEQVGPIALAAANGAGGRGVAGGGAAGVARRQSRAAWAFFKSLLSVLSLARVPGRDAARSDAVAEPGQRVIPLPLILWRRLAALRRGAAAAARRAVPGAVRPAHAARPGTPYLFGSPGRAAGGCAGTAGGCGWPARGGRPGCGGRSVRDGCPAAAAGRADCGEPGCGGCPARGGRPGRGGEPGCCCPCAVRRARLLLLTGAVQLTGRLLSGAIELAGLLLSADDSARSAAAADRVVPADRSGAAVRANHSAWSGRAGIAGSAGSD